MTLFHNMVEASAESKYWNHNNLIQAVIGLWFAASHQPWIVSFQHCIRSFIIADWSQNLHFAFLELCARPEFADLIYDEIKSVGALNLENIDRLPILDSFIKESVRINPLDKSEYMSS